MAHINQEIPREQWESYLAGISRQDATQWVRVESIDAETGDQPLADRLPLVDISLERKGSDAGAVQIIVGREDGRITHRILEPDHLYAELDGESGALECLEIGERGGKTLVFFERATEADEASARF
ncbi:DUF5335 family protein [Corallococcus exiguus]|uniref:Uncharacterized protein n=1 Tax=Corallococcus exiguus TaxID=83462 RepID=A0A7Y1WUN4_9BACT|nr:MULTISPECIES: DUF5335 family protein [Corallococcus]NBC38547.1 hypothetical protein [Corallococcus exiguus]NNC16428.1 DUF5335 family protein [Corallococcus exiguus]NRD57913.1 DUF5335 family protein [Corallococcus exiguus]NRD64777.1 DUF5335 family protein [Corallococcus exiguus]RKH27610.1 hypothetical protein D7V77_11245 [Corallococcus sp. CA041A]